MFDKIIVYSVNNKSVIGLLMMALTVWGIFSLRQLPIDAVPDITNNQIQIITTSPTLATQEIEKFITTPIELSLQSLQSVEEIRSISQFGLSVITVVFEEGYDIYLSRQLVEEQLKEAQNTIPQGFGTPKMGPISTGLGEVYQYIVHPTEEFLSHYSLSDLRTIQDWIVKRQLLGIEGVAEVNSIGGYLKQYEVAVNPHLLKSMNISIVDVLEALKKSNENTGGAYIEKNSNMYYIRSEGLARSFQDIENIVLIEQSPIPVLIKDVAKVQFGKAPRYGALVKNGEEVVGGKIMMFKGANSAEVIKLVKERVVQIQKSLPEGVVIEPYLVRDKLINTVIGTVKKNLIEGGLIVIFILVLFLGNWRAGLIVASVIPFSMLFAISMMNLLGISANLMSLGAIDFGLIVDGAVIIVEAIVHKLHVGYIGKKLTQKEMDNEVIVSSQKIRNSAAFGEIIILIVYIPILALVGIEGKTFKPMAQTVMLAITGALIFSFTYVPMISSLFLNKEISKKHTISDCIIEFCQRLYTPVLKKALRLKSLFLGGTLLLFLISIVVFKRMGAEFVPTLEEGDLAMQQKLPPGHSLHQSIEIAKVIQNKLLDEFPEIEDVVVNIGSAEIPTDPMPIEIGDYTMIMKPKSEWVSARSRHEMFEKIEKSLTVIPGVDYEFSQPIQLRFNELITGTKADIALSLFGDDLEKLYNKAKEAEKIIAKIDGVGTVNVEQTLGMPQIIITYNYNKMAQYGLYIKEVNQIIRSAFAGEKVGVIYEGEKQFDLVVRLAHQYRGRFEDVQNLSINLKNGTYIPLSNIATIKLINAPMQISREDTKRRIIVGINVGDKDIETVVEDIQKELNEKIKLPVGYYFVYGGQFENLKLASTRLSIALPIALILIFVLLYFTFNSLSQTMLIFTTIPLSAIGGIWALQLRGLPFSISAGIGFIALFGVAVLNGIVLIGYFNQLKKEGILTIRERILEGTKVRLRPVLITAIVASFGFFPMAISTSGGAEVQRPLATVVIGGLITATFLTLIVLPLLYEWVEQRHGKQKKRIYNSNKGTLVLFFLLGFVFLTQAQDKKRTISLDSAIQIALNNHPTIKATVLKTKKMHTLQNMKYNVGTTNVFYQGDGLFQENGQRVNQIGITQNFPSPSLTKAYNALQNELYIKNSIAKKMTENELKYNVKKNYFDVQYTKELKKFYTHLVDVYTNYYTIAKTRLATGETSKIEPLSIQSQLNKYTLLVHQKSIEISNLEKMFQLILRTPYPVAPYDSLIQLNQTTSDSTSIIWLYQNKQDIAIETAKIDIMKAKKKPSFKITYALQKYFEDGWLSGLQGGVNIPLFNSQIKKRITAQKLNVDIATVTYQSKVLEFNQQLIAIQTKINLYKEGIKFYTKQLQTINPEITKITQLNYQAGELSFLELLNTLQLIADTNRQYWVNVVSYNKAIAYYQLLTNQ